MQMADMEESFESSDEASDSGKQGSDQQNEASENEMEHSGNEGGESGDENADSGNENVASEEEPSSPVESEAEEGRGESSDERQSEAHSEHGESEDGGNVDSDNQNVSDNEEGGSQNAESDNENAASGNERESEGERVASDNENANSDDEHENVRASDDEGSYEEQAQERTNVESEDERSDQGDDDNERNSEQEDVEGSANEQENDNQEASGAESEREVAGSDSEQEQPEGGQSDVEMNSDDGANGEADEEATHRGSEAEESDNEGDSHESKKEATAEALFGDADDISSGSDAEGKTGDREDKGDQELADGSVKGSPMQTAQDEHDEEAQEEQQPEEIPETRIDVEIPKITTDLGKEIHFVKLPNFISVETRPFDHQTYEDEIDEDEVLDEEGRARLKLKVENTVRWRWGYDNDGNPVKESNARIVKWSDGSMSLNLGSEIFDVHKQLLQGDHNHLFIRQGTGLQGQAVFRTKLTFRPHSTDSFTHRKITMSVADRSQKTQKIRILPTVGKDPEAHRSEMIKKEEDRLKASIRRENKQRRMKERAISRGLSSSYLEPDRYEDEDEEDDGAISLAAIKNKYKKGALRENRPPIYSSDSDASDIDDRRARRLEKAKALSDSDEGSIEEVGPKKKMARIEESDEDDD